MLIKNLFERDIFRPINGVVKADQIDESSVWQELDEFVITRELDGHFRRFIEWYLEGAQLGGKVDPAGKMGVWISGFFGSGKSHLLKVLSYLLKNGVQTHDGQSKRTVEFFETKIADQMLFGDVKRAVADETDVILFNIDSKAGHGSGTGHDLILRVFLKVLNELQGFSGDHPHIADMERYLSGKGLFSKFEAAYQRISGETWQSEKDAYAFNQDKVVAALMEATGESEDSCTRWIDGAEDRFTVSVENFCKWVKEYLDSKGPKHRIAFLVDEVGQFIGTDSKLMLSLQTITEELGTICKRRAWVVVTSQEDMDAVLGDMSQTKKQDFSKIQGRFFPPLSLSSANVDEVIQARLLAKPKEVADDLKAVFATKGDILKNQISFTDCGMTFRQFKDPEDFAKNYPFAPYQFQLIQKIFESIRRAGATGAHLAKGERSMLDAFQSAAKTVSSGEVGILVPLYDFYPAIESFLDTMVKKTIDQSALNPGLQPFDVKLIQVLFLIRYVEEIKGNINNLVTLCLDRIDADRMALRQRIEEGLARLEKETLINRNGDVYLFLTNEERDISKEIKGVKLDSGDESKLLAEILFDDVLVGASKHRYSVNGVDFQYNKRCDQYPIGAQREGGLLISIVSPAGDGYADHDNGVLNSTSEQGCVVVRLGDDPRLGRELRRYKQTEQYLKSKNDGSAPETTKRILREVADDNRTRRERLALLIGELFTDATVYVAGQVLTKKGKNAAAVRDEAMEYLIENSFKKMGYLKHLLTEPLKEVQATLRSNDVTKETLLLQAQENNPDALVEVRDYVSLCARSSVQIVLHDMLNRFGLRPYGWPENEILLLLARLIVLGEVKLTMDGGILETDKIYDAITSSAKRRKILVVKRETTDPKAINDARTLGKDLFMAMGPDGEEALFQFLKDKLSGWQSELNSFKPLADTGAYPGADAIATGITLISPLLADVDSKKFIERFNLLKDDLLDFADQFHDLQHFYTHQRAAWDSLGKARTAFDLNGLELQHDPKAGPALKRMKEILAAKNPYALIKEAPTLIDAVSAVNSQLLSARRNQSLAKIDANIELLTKDLDLAKGDDALRRACLDPLTSLRKLAEDTQILAHVAQYEAESVKAYDAGVELFEKFVAKATETKAVVVTGFAEPAAPAPTPVVKKQRIVRPVEIAKSAYLETLQDVDRFLEKLRAELEQAIDNNERIQIR